MTTAKGATTRRSAPWLATIVLLIGSPPVALGEEVVYDYARVVWVEPLTEPATAPAPPRRCTTRPEGLGRLPDDAGSAGLAAAIRTEAARAPAAPACEEAPDDHAARQIVGYRVGYRYGGEVYERTVRDRPGDRLRVRVSLQPAGQPRR
jgi:hypothetical protein